MSLQHSHRQILAVIAIGATMVGKAMVGIAMVATATIGTASAQEAADVTLDPTASEETVSPLDETGHLVRFDRDIAPILRSRCLECHGPQDAKNDFRVDDVDSLMDYIDAGDIESSLYVDYLVTDDEDSLMPPQSHGGPLGPEELALIRVWIEEGAEWPEGFELSNAAAEAPKTEPRRAPQTFSERAWVAQGFLHPATVHFPIALFLLGGGFVVLGWKWPAVGFQIPLACLLLGTLTAIASTAMGWSFAPERGYGENWSVLDWGREIDVHRWSGMITTLIATCVSITALAALWNDSEKLTRYWKIGLLVCAGAVGAVGHQGGELSYGKDFYPKAFRILIGADETPKPVTKEPVSEGTAEEKLPAEESA